MEELNPKFANTKIFSKLDATANGQYIWMRLSTPNNILLSIWQILLEMFVFWSESVTRFLPGQDGPDPQGAPQHDQYSSVCGKDDKDHDRNLINLISGRSRGGRDAS